MFSIYSAALVGMYEVFGMHNYYYYYTYVVLDVKEWCEE